MDLPHVEFIQQSLCIRVERNTYWNAIAIQILGFCKTATESSALASCKLNAIHSAVVYVADLSALELAEQLLAARHTLE